MLNVKHLDNRIQPNFYLSKFQTLPFARDKDNRLNPQSDEKATDGSRVDRIPIMLSSTLFLTTAALKRYLSINPRVRVMKIAVATGITAIPITDWNYDADE